MRHTLKICLTTLAPFIGGAEVAAERLALGLQELGHDVLLVLGKRGEVMERMQRAGLRCVFAPMYCTDKWHWWRYYKARTALQSLLASERPDVVHSNDLLTHQMVSDAALRLHIPRVCHHRFPFAGVAIDWLNKYGAERHLFVSQALMEEMCALSEQLSASSRAVVHDGLPLPEPPSEAARQQARCRLGLAPEKIVVTFAGQIIERKGIADLLRAWALLDPNVRQQAALLLIGDDLRGAGAYRLAMQQLAGELRCDAQFVGFQKNVGEWLRASDIAVVPSHVEPLGNATLEAMSYALPVIGCAVGGIAEMLVHEQTGLLVPPKSPEQLALALTRLLSKKAMRLCYGLQARKRCEQLFTIQIHVHNVVKEYKKAIQTS
jgi:glycosyltransferase involved in cell wall biosynthesis